METIEEILLNIKQRRERYLISYAINGNLYSETLNSLMQLKFSDKISPALNCHSIEIVDSNNLNDILAALSLHNDDGILTKLQMKYHNTGSKKYLVIAYFNLDNFKICR